MQNSLTDVSYFKFASPFLPNNNMTKLVYHLCTDLHAAILVAAYNYSLWHVLSLQESRGRKYFYFHRNYCQNLWF